jgi:hypothetical protein
LLASLPWEPYTVVGVMPAGFHPVDEQEVWLPWVFSADEQRERRFHVLGAVARLRRGRTAATAQTEIDPLYRQLQRDHPDTTAQWTARVLPLRELLLGESGRALTALGVGVLALVAVAWMNVASLLLAWLPTRRQEFLVRIAIGAGPLRVVRQLVARLDRGGTVGGILVARWFIDLFGAGYPRRCPSTSRPASTGACSWRPPSSSWQASWQPRSGRR